MFKKTVSIVSIFLILISICIAVRVTSTWASEKPVKLVFVAMRVGTGWYVWGATISKLLEKVLPHGSSVELLSGGGGIANPLILANGKADIGISSICSTRWAYDGIMMYKGKESKTLRALTGGFAKIWVMQYWREDFIKKTGIDSLEKLAEKKYPIRVITKTKGSLIPPTAELMLAQYGMSFEKIKKWGGAHIQVAGGQIPVLIRDGRADLSFEAAFKGHPATTEATMTADLRLVGLPDRVIKNFAKYGMWGDTMPANSYRLQTKPIKSILQPPLLATTQKLPEEIAYLVTKVVCENKDEMVAAHAAWKVFQPEKSWELRNTGIPLHSGAERYYRERGWMK